MTNRELEYIRAIAEEHTISGAAKKLYIAQPSLSHSLQRIEENLGISLFNRSTSGLTLTYAGEKYYQVACQILKIYDDFQLEVSDINGLKTGRIMMGIANRLGSLILPEVVPDFHSKYPGVELEISEESTSSQEEQLFSGKLDFAILHALAGIRNPQLEYEFLRRYPFVIVLPAGHPLAAKAVKKAGYEYPVLDIKLLNGETCIMINKAQRIRHVVDAVFDKAKLKPKTLLTTRNYETALALTEKGAGVTVLPLNYTKRNPTGIPAEFFSIEKKYGAYWDLCIMTMKGTFLSHADKYFLDLVREKFSD